MKRFFTILSIALMAASACAADITETKIDSILTKANDAFTIDVKAYNNVGSVLSNDGKLRIISWNNRLSDGTFEYYTYFIFKKKAKSKAMVKKVVCSEAFKPANSGKYTANNWYGCLYFDAVAVKGGYILLGYQTYRDISRVKLVEPMKISGSNIAFGDDVFKIDGKTQSRAVFEYSDNAAMGIEYDPAGKRFIFDHLSPENPNLKGLFQYYGPDFTYDALCLKKKFWTLREDIDIKNK